MLISLMKAYFIDASILLRSFFLAAFLVKGKAFLRWFSTAKAFFFFLKKANISHLTCFNLLMHFLKKAKLYNISRSLQASNKKLPLSAFNFVDAASSDAFCLLSSNKVKLFNIILLPCSGY